MISGHYVLRLIIICLQKNRKVHGFAKIFRSKIAKLEANQKYEAVFKKRE